MRILVFLVTYSFLSYVNAQSAPSIAEFDIELESNQKLPLADRISFELITSLPLAVAENLQRWENIKVDRIDDEKLLVEMSERPRFTGEVSPKHSLDSFVIDFSERSTKEFASGFTQSKYQPLNLIQLEAYVDEYIDKPTYVNGFNIASIVATQRSGDCTEYAVLLVALARSIGLPARVIIGTVIIEENETVSAFGHAWVEAWHNEQWNILDAALHQSEANQHFYLPAAELEKEGPGFAMSLAKASNLLPQKIRALRSAN
jgi:hypothetical protein